MSTAACVWNFLVPYLTSLLMMRNKAMMESESNNAEPGVFEQDGTMKFIWEIQEK